MTTPGKPLRPEGDAGTLDAIEAIAADWVARRDGGLTPAEEAAFREWHHADPRHAVVLAELEAAWSSLNKPRGAGRGDAFLRQIAAAQQRRELRHRRRFVVVMGLGLAAAAAIVMAFWPLQPRTQRSISPQSAVVVRPDRQLLPDGSSVELNAGADIVVDFSDEKRLVRQVRGEAHFSVTKDLARPFIVEVGGVEIRAIGTAFSIRRDSSQVSVLVTEGSVAVERSVDSRNLLDSGLAAAAPGFGQPEEGGDALLPAGHRIVIHVTGAPVAAARAGAVSATEIADALAWRERRVEFTRTTLADVFPLFNRHNRLRLAAADDAIAQLRISGVFWTDDPEAFARLLQTSLGLAIVRASADEIVFGHAPR